jgi:hypothetical protein
MKKSLLFSLLLACFSFSAVFAVDVTFRVNMAEQAVSPNGVHVAGAFQGWSPSATPLVNTVDDVYEVTVDIPAGTTFEYKFINGNAWSAPNENLTAAGCGVGPDGNRQFTVPAEDVVLPLVCFNACINCGETAPLTSVTFRVNMSQQDVSPNGVHVAGAFQGWNPSASTMVDTEGDGIYEFTAEIAPGATIQYKFINGNDWNAPSVVENLNPAGCGVGNDGNRELVVPDEDIVLEAVCFNGCEACPVIGEPIEVTFTVNMANETISPEGVHLAGSFNDFTPALMTQGEDDLYSLTLSINAGVSVIYKFLNGATFDGQEAVPAACGEPDGFGGNNRTFTPTEENPSPETVCFELCTDCPVIGEPIPVTFLVNMANEDVAAAGPHIEGSFTNFEPQAMTLVEDAIYSYTANIATGSTVIYKFLNGDNNSTQEIVPADCGVPNDFNAFDRSLTIPDVDDFTTELVCFGGCEDCVEPAPSILVFFRVDMQNENIAAAGPHIAGTFNGFTPEPLELESGTVYSYAAMLEVGSTVDYKFLNGATFDGQEAVPADCGSPDGFGGNNRTFTVPDEAMVITEVVCFSACEECPPPPPSISVTFLVDLANEAISSEGPHIAGTFNGFTPASMTLVENSVYSFTTDVEAGSTQLYKFLNGATFDGQESVPAACGEPDGFGGNNRVLEVAADAEEDITLDLVCFSTCEACVEPAPTVLVFFRVNMQNETVDAAGPHIAGSFNGFTPEAMNPESGTVYAHSEMLEVGSTVTYKFLNGATFAGQEAVPADCGEADGFGGFNRTFTIPDLPMVIIDVVCFSACENCEAIPDPVSVTFTVDMGAVEQISAEGAHIAGTFNNFTPEPMIEGANEVYTFTVELVPGTEVLFKYLNGATFDGQEVVPAACGEPDGFGGFNRIITVPAEAGALPIVCFNECEGGCTVSIAELQNNLKMGVFPNPNNGNFNLQLDNFDGSLFNTLYIYDLGGRLVSSLRVHSSTQTINVEGLSKGLYQLVLENNQGRATTKMVVK